MAVVVVAGGGVAVEAGAAAAELREQSRGRGVAPRGGTAERPADAPLRDADGTAARLERHQSRPERHALVQQHGLRRTVGPRALARRRARDAGGHGAERAGRLKDRAADLRVDAKPPGQLKDQRRQRVALGEHGAKRAPKCRNAAGLAAFGAVLAALAVQRRNDGVEHRLEVAQAGEPQQRDGQGVRLLGKFCREQAAAAVADAAVPRCWSSSRPGGTGARAASAQAMAA
eukprot:CAMPEP_0202046132 /NCGR_PEP_ID=MMETSP0963-20130614/1112_1 /ASSEMBLY_ACC=CAM_ASM_000494 /TAXON_ID=4773 /ORGANISM="Schizochytrium aggregatum, Strain ATCC28209" /LENGTH=229 /DNA_ID=CAMNT_0048610763 /DNA_START=134 /DNA_END=821 /DNA_ORIENTATION=-